MAYSPKTCKPIRTSVCVLVSRSQNNRLRSHPLAIKNPAAHQPHLIKAREQQVFPVYPITTQPASIERICKIEKSRWLHLNMGDEKLLIVESIKKAWNPGRLNRWTCALTHSASFRCMCFMVIYGILRQSSKAMYYVIKI